MNKLPTYKKRIAYHLKKWCEGEPIHNDIDDECCPDFSCCNKSLLQPKEVRENFIAASYEERISMLSTFLAAFTSTIEESVYVAGQSIVDQN